MEPRVTAAREGHQCWRSAGPSAQGQSGCVQAEVNRPLEPNSIHPPPSPSLALSDIPPPPHDRSDRFKLGPGANVLKHKLPKHRSKSKHGADLDLGVLYAQMEEQDTGTSPLRPLLSSLFLHLSRPTRRSPHNTNTNANRPLFSQPRLPPDAAKKSTATRAQGRPTPRRHQRRATATPCIAPRAKEVRCCRGRSRVSLS